MGLTFRFRLSWLLNVATSIDLQVSISLICDARFSNIIWPPPYILVPHLTCLLLRPHLHLTWTISWHIVSGHGSPSWHGAAHTWSQWGRGFWHGCVHFCSSVSTHSPLWHVRWHLWEHPESCLLHVLPQLTSFMWHGMLWRISWPPMHILEVKYEHGGHSASQWQLWLTGWSHKWVLVHLLGHSNGFVP